MTLPLAGIRVLDSTNVLAGPFCSHQLGLLGAEVIKIERPVGGDLARSLGADPVLCEQLMGSSFVAVNTGKQSMTIDLKTAEGKTIFKQMTALSHVVLENFRPHVMDRLGLGYSVLREVNPSIVYCAISGFGQDGPLANRQAYDQIIQGMSGAMSTTGNSESGPLRVGYPVCDTTGGMAAALAICAALVQSRTTGRGCMMDISMLEATLSTMGWVVANYLNAGVIPTRMGNENVTSSPSGTFNTAEGLLNIAANESSQFEKLCDLLGRPEWKVDPRFSNRHIRTVNRVALKAGIEEVLATRPATEWEAMMMEAGIPAGRVLTVPEILDHPHLKERQFVSTFDHPTGTQRSVGGGFRISEAEALPKSPAPTLSEHTNRWMNTLGYSEEKVAELRAKSVI
jgi:crotonobetainyl-CoA:carnitine CoA-transferase CaiB-like acyl-CoA transferase